MVDEKLLTKHYYTIGDVSKMFSLNESTLRYWETEFAVLKPQKNRKGDRRYRKEDVLIVDKIYTLVKEKGYTLKGAAIELTEQIKSEKVNKRAIAKLVRIKKGLEKIKKEM